MPVTVDRKEKTQTISTPIQLGTTFTAKKSNSTTVPMSSTKLDAPIDTIELSKKKQPKQQEKQQEKENGWVEFGADVASGLVAFGAFALFGGFPLGLATGAAAGAGTKVLIKKLIKGDNYTNKDLKKDALTGGIGGFFAGGGAIAGKLIGKVAGKTISTLAETVIVGSSYGATDSGARAYLDGKNASEITKDALVGGAIGGVTGGVLHQAGKYIGKGYKLIRSNIKSEKIPVPKALNNKLSLTFMSGTRSNAYKEIESSLLKATDKETFIQLGDRINRMPFSDEKCVLINMYKKRFNIFKNPLLGVTENLSEIFGKRLSQSETRQIANDLRQIMNIQDNSSYTRTMFAYLAEHFGIDRRSISLRFEQLHPQHVAYTTPTCEEIALYVGNNAEAMSLKKNRILLFTSLCHELTHVKQGKIAYGTNPEVYIEALARSEKNGNSEFWRNCLTGAGENSELALERIKKYFRLQINKGPLKFSQPIYSDSPLVQKGLQYINGRMNYKSIKQGATEQEYLEQLIEKEAFEAGDMAEQIINFAMKGLI